MTLTFDTYLKHSVAHKMIEIVSGLALIHVLIFLLFERKLDNTLSDFWQTIFHITFLISFFCFLTGLFISNFSKRISMYVKDGELIINSGNVSIDSKVYRLDDLYKIEFKVAGYRGQGGSRGGTDGTQNKIKIYESSKNIIQKSFVLNTRIQRDNLKFVLIEWKQSGFKVKVDGFDLR